MFVLQGQTMKKLDRPKSTRNLYKNFAQKNEQRPATSLSKSIKNTIYMNDTNSIMKISVGSHSVPYNSLRNYTELCKKQQILSLPTVNVLRNIPESLELENIPNLSNSCVTKTMIKSVKSHKKILFNPVYAQMYKGKMSKKQIPALNQTQKIVKYPINILSANFENTQKGQLLKKRLKWYEKRDISMYSQYYKHNYADNLTKMLLKTYQNFTKTPIITTVASLLENPNRNQENENRKLVSKIEKAKFTQKGLLNDITNNL